MDFARMLLSLVLLVGSSGCGLSPFVQPEAQAVVDEHIFSNSSLFSNLPILSQDGVRALSTKLERRLVIFNRKKTDEGWDLKICAEPPAEAIQALQSINKLEATLKKQTPAKTTVEGSGSGESGLTTAVQSAFRRTQGLQFYRDGAYQWCQAYINNLITRKDFVEKLETLQEKAAYLIQEEVNQEGFYVGTLPQIQIEQLKKLQPSSSPTAPAPQPCCPPVLVPSLPCLPGHNVPCASTPARSDSQGDKD